MSQGGYVINAPTVALSTTAKTVISLISGANEFVSAISKIVANIDSGANCLVELCESTQAGTGTSTDATANLKQIRGFTGADTLAPVQLTARTAFTVEPTVLTRLYAWRFAGPGPLVIDFALGREPMSLVSTATKYKALALRVTVSTGTPNGDFTIDFEIG